jgi:hypothetical protein
LTSLNLASNSIGGSYPGGGGDFVATPEGMEFIYNVHTPALILVHISGPAAIAAAIKDMGALSSLNLASNSICGITQHGFGTYDASGNAHFL